MSGRYFAGVLKALPLLPLLYFQGKQVRKKIPSLPPAEGCTGQVVLEGQNALKLLTIGESTMAGVGVSTHQEGFTGALAKQLAYNLQQSIHWSVYAESGYTAEKVRKEIIPNIEEQRIDMIVIGLGGNDAFSLHTPWKWNRDIRELLFEVRNIFPHVPVFFTHMPPIRNFPAFTPTMQSVIGGLVELLGEELAKTIQEFTRVYYPGEIITIKKWADKFDIANETSYFFSDGVHPSQLTYELWAKDMADFICTHWNDK